MPSTKPELQKSTQTETKIPPCNPACTKIIKFMTDRPLPASAGITLESYSDIKGYRFINVAVQFSQYASDEAAVDLAVIFAFDGKGTMAAHRYVIVDSAFDEPQNTNFIRISGARSWQGSTDNKSSYSARIPIMGPFINLSIYNHAAIQRTVSVWGYLIS